MIVINHLCKHYFPKNNRVNEVLRGIDMEIREGERVAIVGENGCGKSTLMKTIGGILTPTAGSVVIDGYNVNKHRVKIHRFCSFVFGNRPQLEWDVPLKDGLSFCASFYKYGRREFANYLQWAEEAFELKNLLDVRLRELSLGQRMRADIARAFLPNLRYLFLDEHTVGVDAQNVKLINRQLSRECEKRKLTLVMSTHDLNAIKSNTDTLYLLENGKIAKKHDVKALLIDSVYNMSLVFRKRNNNPITVDNGISAHVHLEERGGGICTLHYNSHALTKSDVFSGLPIEKIDIDSVAWQEFALDDYLATYGKRT